MSNSDDSTGVWLPVIGRALAFLCMQHFPRENGDLSVMEKVKFLESLGIPEAEAAVTAGSNLASVRVMRRREKKRGKRGSKK